MSPESARRVVVGVDGSRPARAALDWAIEEAHGRDLALHIVHAFIWPLFKVPLGPSPFGPPEGGLRAEAKRTLEDAARHAYAEAPGLTVRGWLRSGMPPSVLLAEAADAELVVLGSRGLGGFTGLLVGSVSTQVAEYAPCPVVVTRSSKLPVGNPPSQNRVVVGVDGSPESETAVVFAFEEASRLGAGLTAVRCLTSRFPAALRDEMRFAQDGESRAAERGTPTDVIAGWLEKYPHVGAMSVIVRGNPAEELTRASRGARLLVVGSRGRGGFAGMLLGSVSRAVLHHADCPVAVVHSDR